MVSIYLLESIPPFFLSSFALVLFQEAVWPWHPSETLPSPRHVHPLFSQAKLAKPSVSEPLPFSCSGDELQMFGIFPSKSFCLLPSSLLLEKPSQVHLIKASPPSKAPCSHNQSLKVVVSSQLYERPPKILMQKPCSLPRSSSAIPFHLLQDHFYAEVQTKTPLIRTYDQFLPVIKFCQLLSFSSLVAYSGHISPSVLSIYI